MFQHTLETGGILVNLEQTNPSVLPNDETVKLLFALLFISKLFKITDRKVGSDENNNSNNNKLQYGRRKK